MGDTEKITQLEQRVQNIENWLKLVKTELEGIKRVNDTQDKNISVLRDIAKENRDNVRRLLVALCGDPPEGTLGVASRIDRMEKLLVWGFGLNFLFAIVMFLYNASNVLLR